MALKVLLSKRFRADTVFIKRVTVNSSDYLIRIWYSFHTAKIQDMIFRELWEPETMYRTINIIFS